MGVWGASPEIRSRNRGLAPQSNFVMRNQKGSPMNDDRKARARRARLQRYLDAELQAEEKRNTQPDQWEPYRGADGKMTQDDPESW